MHAIIILDDYSLTVLTAMLRFYTPNSAPVDKSEFRRRRALMQKRKIFFSFVLSALLSILLYIVLHEAGHCIVAILCGATITEFSILSAHMNYSGGNFTALSALFLSANGILFPLFLSYIYTFLYRAAAMTKLSALSANMSISPAARNPRMRTKA